MGCADEDGNGLRGLKSDQEVVWRKNEAFVATMASIMAIKTIMTGICNHQSCEKTGNLLVKVLF